MMNIFEAINGVMNDATYVGKDSKNSQQGFYFRGIDAVMNAFNPLLTKYKIFVVPQVLEQTREERTNGKGTTLLYSICKIKFTFYAEDGSFVEAITVGEGMDTGDKATNKAMAVAFKYALFQVFCIPTEEMKQDDPDNECHEVAPKNTPAAKAEKKEATKEDTKADAEQEAALRAKVIGYVNRHKFDKKKIDMICKAYSVNNLNEFSLIQCQHYINVVKQQGGNIDE